MDIDTLRLNALVRLAGKIPDDTLHPLGSLAHLSLWLSPRSRRRLHSGLAGVFGFGTTNLKRGIRRLLRITELDHDMRTDAAREAVRLRRAVPLLKRETVRKFFAALREASVLRDHYQFLLDPVEDEEALDTIFAGTAFRSGGLVSGLIQGRATAPSTPAPPPRLVVDPENYLRWDADLGRLWCGDRLIKEYREEAENQKTILAAFEEEGWPHRIDDPLPGVRDDRRAKRRLRDTITGLNQDHVAPGVMRFRGDGTGRGVRWYLTK